MSMIDARTILRNDKLPNGRELSSHEREQLIKPFLPPSRPDEASPAPSRPSDTRHGVRQSKARSLKPFSIRSLIGLFLYKLLFALIQLTFSIHIRTRQVYHAIRDKTSSLLYYHHRSPELIRKDVKSLGKLPRHLSIILELKSSRSKEAIDELMGEVAELSTWCACAGIGMLSIYERTGALKHCTPELHHTTMNTLATYFPRGHRPTIHIASPDNTAYSPSPSPSRSPSPTPFLDGSSDSKPARPHLNILLLSAQDGRDTLVDLTKTLAEMSQKGKLKPSDVTTELIHAEIEEGSGCGEPDLLVVMLPARSSSYIGRRIRKGRRKQTEGGKAIRSKATAAATHHWAGFGMCLHGYPPWQVRLTEIFHVKDNSGVGYQLFLRALYRYAKAEMRLGR